MGNSTVNSTVNSGKWRITMANPKASSKILIIDDDPDLRQGLKLRLRANHYDTVHAVDGDSALTQAHKEQPDLIILDLGLPAGDGFVVLDRLHNDDRLCDIPVIVLTARDPQSSE